MEQGCNHKNEGISHTRDSNVHLSDKKELKGHNHENMAVTFKPC